MYILKIETLHIAWSHVGHIFLLLHFSIYSDTRKKKEVHIFTLCITRFLYSILYRSHACKASTCCFIARFVGRRSRYCQACLGIVTSSSDSSKGAHGVKALRRTRNHHGATTALYSVMATSTFIYILCVCSTVSLKNSSH